MQIAFEHDGVELTATVVHAPIVDGIPCHQWTVAAKEGTMDNLSVYHDFYTPRTLLASDFHAWLQEHGLPQLRPAASEAIINQE